MKIFEKLENIFSAVAFAEAGEADTAVAIMKEDGGGSRGSANINWRCEGYDCPSPAPSK